MNLKHIGILFGKELIHGSKTFFFIFAVLMPLICSLAVSLIFGSLFSEKPRLGIVDFGNSQLVQKVTAADFITSDQFPSVNALRKAVEAGTMDMGLVLPQEFDSHLKKRQWMEVTLYVWGESLIKDRAILVAAMANYTLEVVGREAPVEINTITLGDGEVQSWAERFLPLLILMAVVMAGCMIPSTSLVDEKQNKTLTALIVTPASQGDVVFAKGLLGAVIGVLTAVMILMLNRAFGAQTLLLILVLSMGAIMSASFGILLGMMTKDINTLFATLKAIGLLLYAPALINLIPQIPDWVAKIFPTYYIIAPVIEVAQRGGRWPDIATDIWILTVLIMAVLAAVTVLVRKKRVFEI
jgi:ABC-2 type transport system permease protein